MVQRDNLPNQPLQSQQRDRYRTAVGGYNPLQLGELRSAGKIRAGGQDSAWHSEIGRCQRKSKFRCTGRCPEATFEVQDQVINPAESILLLGNILGRFEKTCAQVIQPMSGE